jgi:hypothetical protein
MAKKPRAQATKKPKPAEPPAAEKSTPGSYALPASAAEGRFRNRNVAMRRVPAGDLIPHPKNWRSHSAFQSGALKGVLGQVGFVGTLLARETPDGLQLIDGHLRAETMEEELVDVMVVDLNDQEVDLILATHDPLGELADGDATQLDDLIAQLDVSNGEIASMLSDLMDSLGGADVERPKREQPGVGGDEGCEYPLVPVFNEKYEYAVIFCKNDTEWGALQTLLGLERQKSYKSTGIAIGRVVPAPRFFQLWENRDADPDHLPKSQPGEDLPDSQVDQD